MPKYLLQVSYTLEGTRGLMKDGGSKRRDAARALVESLGGKLESFYFAFGNTDAFAIADLPDDVAAASASLTVTGSGGAKSTVTVLQTPEQVDEVTKKSPSYTPPGR